MLSKHWDIIRILPIVTSLLMTYGSTPFDPKVNSYGNTHDIQTNGLSTTPHSSCHHLHTKLHITTYYYSCKQNYISLHIIIHVSTRTCHIHHKRGVTEVWHIVHFWVSYGRCSMPGSPIGWSEGQSRLWAN